MKTESTYSLLVRSEEKERNVLEIALYATFGLSALVAILQFMQQPDALPLNGMPPVTAHTLTEHLPS